jgi:hypothetical protein
MLQWHQCLFDGGRPLDASISKRLKIFSNEFEKLQIRKTNFVKTNLEGTYLPQEKADIGTSNGANNVVSSLLYNMLLNITSMQ